MNSSVFWDITPWVRWKSTDVPEEHIASIFRVEEQAKQETSMTARRYIPEDTTLQTDKTNTPELVELLWLGDWLAGVSFPLRGSKSLLYERWTVDNLQVTK
jgi:hypothetical protein